MATSEQLDALLLRWKAARQTGKATTVEALCTECPQLAEELRQRIQAAEAEEHSTRVADDDPHRTVIADTRNGAEQPHWEPLPRIPGYEILRVVDQGGMGTIYEAVQLNLGRKVAIKMISSTRLAAKIVARFQAEAEAAAQLQHANFVQVYEVGQVNGRPFFSMEYVTGGSLADRLARQPFTARQAAELMETLARAVQTAHESRIVHRDLKPGNVMLTGDGTPKIADFGLAKRLGDDSGQTKTGEILGTPSYMAPEQAEGRKEAIGPATDVYALGAILYELLTNKPPFEGTSTLDSLRLIVTQEPLAPSRLRAGVPRDLEAICLKCLEKAPGQRYGSARELADDLRRFLNGQPIVARRIGLPRRAWKWVGRHPQGAALAGVLILLVLLPAIYLFGEYRARRQTRVKAEQQALLVREILQRNCAECHNREPGDGKKQFNILNYSHLLDPQRRIVVPGSTEESRLIQRIADGSMPPEEDELRLPRVSDTELTILREWIRGGAPAFPLDEPQPPTPPVVPYSEVAAQTEVIFKERCYECHKYDVARGGIKILNHRLLVKVRKVVIPGQPDESELLGSLTSTDPEIRMPLAPAKPLSADEIATIRRWISEGAPPFPKLAEKPAR